MIAAIDHKHIAYVYQWLSGHWHWLLSTIGAWLVRSPLSRKRTIMAFTDFIPGAFHAAAGFLPAVEAFAAGTGRTVDEVAAVLLPVVAQFVPEQQRDAVTVENLREAEALIAEGIALEQRAAAFAAKLSAELST